MRRRITLLAAGLLLLAGGCGAAGPEPAATTPAPAATDCLPGSAGFLRARLRGAVNADLDWKDIQLRCEGGARPDGGGIRVSFAGPLPDDAGAGAGRTLRFVFGIDSPVNQTQGTALATNVTAIVEGHVEGHEGGHGEPALYATRGDDKCTTDTLSRHSIAARPRDWSVEARGFCTGPATTLDGADRVLVTTFDFAGRVTLETP